MIAAAAVAAVLAWLVSYLAGTRRWKKSARESALALEQTKDELMLSRKDIESQKAVYEQKLSSAGELAAQKISELENSLSKELERAAASLQEEKERGAKAMEDLRAGYEKSLGEMKENYRESLGKQVETLKSEMLARTEDILKKRQEELDKKAEETFQAISGNLGKDLKEMKTAFEENKTRASEDNASMKEKFDAAVRQLAEQTRSIGDKADHLAEAMRGQKKMQGCWGETILQNLLDTEGLQEGRDYDKEETLRDSLGMVLLNEDSDKRMRPDYILHFVDGQDVIIDSKVSLSAFADYLEAQTDEQRQDAAQRNAAAIKEQVKKLAAKKYADYLKPGHRMVDYVIMFVPNYPALQLAYDIDPAIWKNAYAQKVLITSSETLMPFLRMISLAWRNVEQVKNQQEIIKAAENMITRVAEFSGFMATLGTKLEDAQKAFESADKKLKNAGQGILVSAHQVAKLGIASRKALPEPED